MTEQQIRDLFTLWQSRLGLAEWRITVMFEAIEPGTITMQKCRQTAPRLSVKDSAMSAICMQHRTPSQLRLRRLSLDMRQIDVAIAAGISRQYLVQLEAGRSIPSWPTAAALSRALSCRPEEIFPTDQQGGRVSAKIMGRVWDLDLARPQQTVLLALADHADHEGGNVFPSVALVAWKTGYSYRQVQRILRTLEDDELIVCVVDPGDHRPAEFVIELDGAPLKVPLDKGTDKRRQLRERKAAIRRAVTKGGATP